jgi:hypothetical protein
VKPTVTAANVVAKNARLLRDMHRIARSSLNFAGVGRGFSAPTPTREFTHFAQSASRGKYALFTQWMGIASRNRTEKPQNTRDWQEWAMWAVCEKTWFDDLLCGCPRITAIFVILSAAKNLPRHHEDSSLRSE